MEPFIAQIVMFGGNFAPRGWAFCDGQLLAISQNTALFSLIGTMYGGDGRTTFALPDLRGRVAIHPGHGPGLSDYRQGQKGGQETVTLSQVELPNHTHQVTAQGSIKVHEEDANSAEVGGKILANSTSGNIYSNGAADASLAAGAIELNVQVGNSGGNQPHANMPPYNTVQYIIALVGIFPSRS